ncbi:hypothetical protein D3C73_995990 [compost metagenome]
MGAFSVVKLQCTGQGLQHALRDAGEVSALQAGVILHTHSGEHGHLAATKSRDTPVSAVGRQSGLLGGNFRPPSGKKVACLSPIVHASYGMTFEQLRESLSLPLTTVTPCVQGNRVRWRHPPTFTTQEKHAYR